MTYEQKLRARQAALLAERRALLAAADAESRALSDEEFTTIEGLEADEQRIDRTLAQLDRDAAASRARVPDSQMGTQPLFDGRAADHPVDGGQASTTTQTRVEVRERERAPGQTLGTIVRAVVRFRGDHRGALNWATTTYGERAPETRALQASVFEAGGALIRDDWADDVIELLRPMSVVRQSLPTLLPMDSGTFRLPRMTGGAQASYIGESQNLPKTQPTVGQLVLQARKLGGLVPVSNDLIRSNAPSVDQLIRDDLTAALGQKSDGVFIRSIGSEYEPKGLRYWAAAANVIPANATVNLTNITLDLGKLELALVGNNVRMLRPGYLLSPRVEIYLRYLRDGNGNYAFPEMERGVLRGYPYKRTTQIPSNLGGGTNESEVYFVDFADVVIGEQRQIILDASSEAAYFDGANVQAAFSRDESVVRGLMLHDLVVRHEYSVAVLTQVTWGG